MGLLARIIGSVRTLFGGTGSEKASAESATDTEPSTDESAADASDVDAEPAERRCPVCGTDVEPDGDACPLCGSTALSPDAGTSADGESTDSPNPDAVATDGEDTDAAAERLRELRDG